MRGLLALETDPMGNKTCYFYDSNQNLIKKSHSDTGICTEYDYDLQNRLIRTFEKNLSGQLETQFVYDASGYKIRETDLFGNETIYENDSLGRPIRITYPETRNGLKSLNPTYIYEYDLFDNPVSITDPQGKVLTKTYNVKGSPANVYYPDGTRETFRYDSSGNLHEHSCKNGIREVFEYDYMGRPSMVRYYRKGSTSISHSFTTTSYGYTAFHKDYETDTKGIKTSYTYNAAGRLTSMSTGNQKTDFIYDALGRVTHIKKWKTEKDFSLQIKEYDLLDRIIEEKTENSAGQTLLRERFIYNDAGYLARIIGYPQNKESILMHYEYDGAGRVIKATNGVGNSTHVIYDDCHINVWGQKGSKRTSVDSMGICTEEFL